MAPTLKGIRRRGQVLQPVALNNPFHNLKIGRRTGKPLNIKARKDSDGFDNIDDYFRDEDLDSDDENSCPPNSDETKGSSKENESLVQNISSELAEENSTVVSTTQGSDLTLDEQVTSQVKAGVKGVNTPAVAQEFDNDEGTAVKSDSMADPTPIIHGTRKRLKFQSESSPTESEVKSKVNPKKRSAKRNVRTRSAPDGESDEEIDVTGVDSDDEDGDKQNNDVIDVVSATLAVAEENSNSVVSDHEENDENNSPVAESCEKNPEVSNLAKKRKENPDKSKESDKPTNYINDKSQHEKTVSVVDIINVTNNNTFLTIGNASCHGSRVIEEVPPSPASSSGLIDKSVGTESISHKCMSPEFGPSLKIDDFQKDQQKNTKPRRSRASKKSDKEMNIDAHQLEKQEENKQSSDEVENRLHGGKKRNTRKRGKTGESDKPSRCVSEIRTSRKTGKAVKELQSDDVEGQEDVAVEGMTMQRVTRQSVKRNQQESNQQEDKESGAAQNVTSGKSLRQRGRQKQQNTVQEFQNGTCVKKQVHSVSRTHDSLDIIIEDESEKRSKQRSSSESDGKETMSKTDKNSKNQNTKQESNNLEALKEHSELLATSVKQKKGKKKKQDQKGNGNEPSLERNEEVFEVNHNICMNRKSSESSPDNFIDPENVDSRSTEQEAIKEVENKEANNSLKMNKMADTTVKDAVAKNSSSSQGEDDSKLPHNRKRRKRAATLTYKPASKRNRKQKQNVKESCSKEDNNEGCTIMEETKQKGITEDRKVKSRNVSNDMINSYSNNQGKNSETEEIATDHETDTGAHPSPTGAALSPIFLGNEEIEPVSAHKGGNSPCPSASSPISAVRKSILKSGKTGSGKSTGPIKRKVTITRKSQSESGAGGSDADDEAQGNDEPVNKRRSSVSFAPKSTFLGSVSDDDQSLSPKRIKGFKGKLSFVSTNSCLSSEDKTFTTGGSSHLHVTSSSESPLDTSLETNEEITLQGKSSVSGSAAATGLRRSRRKRVSPLKFWKNERIEYDTRRKSGYTFKRIIRNPTPKLPERRKPKAKAKKKNPVEDSEDDVYGSEELPEGLTEEVNPTATVINPDTEEEVALDLFHVPEMLNFLNVSRKPATENDPLIIDKYMQHNQFSVGQFVLRGGADKGRQHVRHDTMIFYVLQGKILVTVHETTAVLNKGSTFFVPQGNAYQVKNLRRSDASILFVQVKGYQADSPS